ncbi:MAG TPA: cobaltochelatase subunit CobN, partial [Magnetospirillum sp.]|nr:cobaltochelatase subunit CobN [Magnetospirillum sp.]
MHLLAAQPGTISDGSEAIDLGQTPGQVVVLSAADTELSALAAAHAKAGAPFELRLANLSRLAHHMSVDLYLDQVVAHARLVVVRLLGGRSYWPYGVEQIATLCRRRNILLACLPGDDKPDAELMRDGTLDPQAAERLWRYLVFGGPDNAAHFLNFAASLTGSDTPW